MSDSATIAFAPRDDRKLVENGLLFAPKFDENGLIVAIAQDADRDSNTVEVFIARLRRKLGGAAIETVRGMGYRMGATS